MTRTSVPVRLAALLLAAGSASAQTGQSSPLDAATASKTDKPVTVDATPRAADPQVEQLLRALTGSYESPAQGDRPALRLNVAPIEVEGLGGALYLEISRADSPGEPFRQGVLHGYKRQGELRLRVLDLVGSAGLKDTMTGLWVEPSALPKLTLAQLDPNLDIALKPEGSGFRGTTPHPYPTSRDGAVEMTSGMSISGDRVTMTDAGLDADGKKVWGTETQFNRSQAALSATKSPEGLIIVTLAKPATDAEKLVEGGEVVVHYTGWLTDGTKFDSSRMPGREPFKIRIPGGVIQGWNQGLKDIAKGERRRLIIPPALGYGERGAGRVIPPNATLIFDVEALHVDNSNPQPPVPPPAPPAPASTGGAAPASGQGNPAGGTGSGSAQPK